MKRPSSLQVQLIALTLVAVTAYGGYQVWWHVHYYIAEYAEYQRPEEEEPEFFDDQLEGKNPAWDEMLIDPRSLGDWEVNASVAVTRLDCPMIKPDVDEELLALRPSYAAAMEAAKDKGYELLPSVNMIDASAKQFDDGLCATVDLAWFNGELGPVPGPVVFVERVFEQTPPRTPARAFLAAALELAGKKVLLSKIDVRRKNAMLREFAEDEASSKPISFHTWSPVLLRAWKFHRFLQREFTAQELGIPVALAAVLKENEDLLERYRAINAFFGRMTNPGICLSMEALFARGQTLSTLAEELDVRRATVSFFPPAASRETELLDGLFGLSSLPRRTTLMSELIRRIRSGEVDLEPASEDGWYQQQVYALETMLLPSIGQEGEKLLLTADYKRRLIQAFEALMTKRRETHARELGAKKCEKARPISPGQVRPRLRLEPCATFYLRTARSYAFLCDFLTAAVGRECLGGMHGMKADGEREANLADELDAMTTRFYGFYLVTCEDLGMRPRLADDEVDWAVAMQAALAWLDNVEQDADLACDVRVSVPIFFDDIENRTRLWATIGVRLARLDASYARPPRVRPSERKGPWEEVRDYQLGTTEYVLPVDEFAEIELDGMRVLTRKELRAACDRHGDKPSILSVLSSPQRVPGTERLFY